MNDENNDPLDVLWNHVLTQWDNPKAHESLMQLGWQREQLGQVAAWYRQQLDNPERQPTAQAMLQSLTVLATQQLENCRSPQKTTPRWLLWLAAGIFIGALGVLGWAILRG